MKNVSAVRHKFAKGDAVIVAIGAIRGAKASIAQVHFGVAYDVKLSNGEIIQCFQEGELKPRRKRK